MGRGGPSGVGVGNHPIQSGLPFCPTYSYSRSTRYHQGTSRPGLVSRLFRIQSCVAHHQSWSSRRKTKAHALHRTALHCTRTRTRTRTRSHLLPLRVSLSSPPPPLHPHLTIVSLHLSCPTCSPLSPSLLRIHADARSSCKPQPLCCFSWLYPCNSLHPKDPLSSSSPPSPGLFACRPSFCPPPPPALEFLPRSPHHVSRFLIHVDQNNYYILSFFLIGVCYLFLSTKSLWTRRS